MRRVAHVFRTERGWGDTFTAFRADGAVFRLSHRDWSSDLRDQEDPPAWRELPPVPGTPAAEAAESSPAPTPGPTKEKPSWSRTPRPAPRGRPGPGGAK